MLFIAPSNFIDTHISRNTPCNDTSKLNGHTHPYINTPCDTSELCGHTLHISMPCYLIEFYEHRTYTQRHTHTCTQTHTYTHTHAHRNTHTHTHAHRDTHTIHQYTTPQYEQDVESPELCKFENTQLRLDTT